MKLWQKDNSSVDELIEQFTVGKDREFDIVLARYDVQGSIAHVTMLGEAGLLSRSEALTLIKELENILDDINQSRFSIEPNVEDVHSQIELMLTRRLGDTGKKIHSARSRNDQVAVDIKLYLKSEILAIKTDVHQLFTLLVDLSEKYKNHLLPGYTHLQVAMPSSFGLWLAAYAESLIDDLEMLAAAFAVANKNPLGSGAGYGSSLPIQRERTTELLEFKTLNWNSAYAQMSRGKTEKVVAMALSNIAATVAKLAMDNCLYMTQEFNFISYPDRFTTGSSIMPHKKNPDVFELVRARCNRIQSTPNELTLLTTNLPSGYHRDLQLTKEILFPAIEDLKACLHVLQVIMPNLSVRENILLHEKYKFIFSVEAVNDLVRKGVSFREAYRTIGKQIENKTFTYDARQPLHHTHEGSIGNLSNDRIVKEMEFVMKKFTV